MTKRAKENLVFVGSALAVAVAIVAALVALDLGGVDWAGAGRKWFDLIVWTALIFGCVAGLYSRDLRKARCLLVYASAVAAHVFALALYLTRAEAFPNFLFLFLSPFEVAAVGVILLAIGGAKPHRLWRAASPRHSTRDLRR